MENSCFTACKTTGMSPKECLELCYSKMDVELVRQESTINFDK